MKNLSQELPRSSRNVKADPFALAGLDELAAKIADEVEKIEAASGADMSKVKNLAAEMQLRAAQVTEFFINQA